MAAFRFGVCLCVERGDGGNLEVMETVEGTSCRIDYEQAQPVQLSPTLDRLELCRVFMYIHFVPTRPTMGVDVSDMEYLLFKFLTTYGYAEAIQVGWKGWVEALLAIGIRPKRSHLGQLGYWGIMLRPDEEGNLPMDP
jgi:hypothetical protein